MKKRKPKIKQQKYKGGIMKQHFYTIITLDKLKNINTEDYTINELHELIKYKYPLESFRSFLWNNKIKTKRKGGKN